MATLSCNWKKLQAKLKADSTSNPTAKRKADEGSQLPSKRPRVTKDTAEDAVARKSWRSTDTKKKIDSTRSKKMGAVQSKPENEPKKKTSASLALWAEDNDISAEALAEAYDLGLPGNSMMKPHEKDKVNHGLSSGIEIGKYVAIDCEMVGVGPGGYESVLARVSVVDFHGRQVYDSYVKPRERVTDWRTAVSGVSQKQMRFARDFDEVQQQLHDILKDRVLIGHDVKHDLDALVLSHAPRNIRDTSKHQGFKKYGNGRKPALRVLAKEILQIDIQSGQHSSIEDARVTMLLFRKYKSSFDVDHANRYEPKATTVALSHAGRNSKKKQKG